MRAAAPCAVAMLAFAACAPAPLRDSQGAVVSTPPKAAKSEWVASHRGLGFIKGGMPLNEVLTLLGQPPRERALDHRDCSYEEPPGLPKGVSLMVTNDTVMRVDIDSAGVLTEEGVGVGDTEGMVTSLYAGRLRSEKHKYNPLGKYIMVTVPFDTTNLLLFETDGLHVTSIRGGRKSAVELTERCG